MNIFFRRMDEMKYSSIGSITKGLGLFYVGISTIIPIVEVLSRGPNVDIEKLSYGAIVGGVSYFIGDKIHRRELEEYKISLLEQKAGDDEQDRD